MFVLAAAAFLIGGVTFANEGTKKKGKAKKENCAKGKNCCKKKDKAATI